MDYKRLLFDLCKSTFRPLPYYEEVKCEAAHVTVEVIVAGSQPIRGHGTTVALAEAQAAQNWLISNQSDWAQILGIETQAVCDHDGNWSNLANSEMEVDVQNPLIIDQGSYQSLKSPTVDSILKIENKTEDEWLDEQDKLIAEVTAKHTAEVALSEAELLKQRRSMQERKQRRQENLELKTRLEESLTCQDLKRLFGENVSYLKDILAGKVESKRNEAFHHSVASRHALYYKQNLHVLIISVVFSRSSNQSG